jgi:hypothetical protein
MLAESKIPLLCHVGQELAFGGGITGHKLDDYNFLTTPLKYGVKVIAAHCAAPIIPGQEKEVNI